MTSFEGLCEILAKDYQLVPEQMTPETGLTDLEIDSLGVIELIFAIEDKFGVTATDVDSNSARDFATLRDVSNYIDRLIAQRDAAASITSVVTEATSDVATSDPAGPTGDVATSHPAGQ